jgi:ATP-dependent 26S proteasome regulatory subunit
MRSSRRSSRSSSRNSKTRRIRMTRKRTQAQETKTMHKMLAIAATRETMTAPAMIARTVEMTPETLALVVGLRDATTRVLTLLPRINQVVLQARMVAILHREDHALAMLTVLEEEIRLVNQASLDLADLTLVVSHSLM